MKGVLWQMAVLFTSLSLVAVGGMNAVVPDMHRQVVQVLGWMDDATFVNLYAIAQAAPGPNMLVVSLIGWKVAGFPGLAVATLSMIVPTGLIAFAVGRVMGRLTQAPWLERVRDGLIPVAIGLTLASGLVMARAADRDTLGIAVSLGAALWIFFTKRNPLWVLGAGSLASLIALWTGAGG